MKFMGQNEKGQLLLEGEGETIFTTKGIPNENPVILINFRIESVEKISPERETELKEYIKSL